MLHGALQGEAALSPRMAARVLSEFRRLSSQLQKHPILEGEDELVDLTYRELDVLTVAAQGASDKEIAEKLSISIHTVKSHIRNILSKLHVNTRREAARLAKSKGLV